MVADSELTWQLRITDARLGTTRCMGHLYHAFCFIPHGSLCSIKPIAVCRELENLDASVAFTAEDDDNGLIFLTEPPLDNFQPGSQGELLSEHAAGWVERTAGKSAGFRWGHLATGYLLARGVLGEAGQPAYKLGMQCMQAQLQPTAIRDAGIHRTREPGPTCAHSASALHWTGRLGAALSPSRPLLTVVMAAAELFEAERDEEMEQLLASPEKLRDAARSPSLRRAFEELRAASVGSKTPTQSGMPCARILSYGWWLPHMQRLYECVQPWSLLISAMSIALQVGACIPNHAS